jgi:hypothetical protein
MLGKTYLIANTFKTRFTHAIRSAATLASSDFNSLELYELHIPEAYKNYALIYNFFIDIVP